MKKLLFIVALIAICVSAKAEDPAYSIIFSELPYSEGTLYVSATCDDKEILKVAIEIEEDSVTIPVDFSKVIGKKVFIQAFQDLNEDRKLNFDGYGRPSEPFLRTTMEPKAELDEYIFKLSVFK